MQLCSLQLRLYLITTKLFFSLLDFLTNFVFHQEKLTQLNEIQAQLSSISKVNIPRSLFLCLFQSPCYYLHVFQNSSLGERIDSKDLTRTFVSESENSLSSADGADLFTFSPFRVLNPKLTQLLHIFNADRLQSDHSLDDHKGYSRGQGKKVFIIEKYWSELGMFGVMECAEEQGFSCCIVLVELGLVLLKAFCFRLQLSFSFRAPDFKVSYTES